MTRDKLGHALFALTVCLLLTSGQTSPTSAVGQEKKDAPTAAPSTETPETQEPAKTDSASVGADAVTLTDAPKEEQPATEEVGATDEAVSSEGADPPGEADKPVAQAPAAQQPEPRSNIKPLLPDEWVGALKWRSIGPANMSGRITDIAVYEKDPFVFWIASASGGLLKTINNGVTFEHQFDHESTVSIGSVAVAQTDKNIVWVGTGEANPRNSVSWGDGVYKSVDGGKTFKNMGLKKSFQIGRVAIHPTDPNIVYVGALGRLWGPNEERGLYKTTDAGETWEKMLYIDDKTGVVDVQINPDDPDTLIVATYERMRDGFDSNDPATKQGEGSALYKTTNGGKTWMKLTEGLPAGKLGRIGIDYYRKDPNTVYVVLESELVGKQPEDAAYMGITGEDADVGARLTDVTKDGPAQKADLKKGDIVIAVGGKTVHSYRDLTSEIRKHMAGDKTEIEVSRDRKSVLAEVTFHKAPDQQEENGDSNRRRRRRSPFDIGLGGQRENVQEQQGPDGHKYGGVYKSTDGGDSWTRINSVNPRPMYYSQIRVDPRDEKYIYVLGTQLYRSKDGGETFTSDGGRGIHVDHHALWVDPKDGRHMIVGNDGGIHVTYDRMEKWDTLSHVAIGQFYHVTVDSRRNYRVYGGLQDNGSWGGPSRSRHGRGPINQDWFRIGGGDGFICLTDREDPDLVYFESQNGGMGRLNLRTGERGFIRPRAPRGGRGQPGARGASGSGGPSGRAGARAGGARGTAVGGDAAAGGRADASRRRDNRRAAASGSGNAAGSGRGSAGRSAGSGPPGARGQGGPRGERRQRYRFNWKTPFVLSHHNSRIHYSAGNYVFRSLNRGQDVKTISPEITRTSKGAATALSESPLDSDVLYVGTNDGAMWGTRNGGHEWTKIIDFPDDEPEDDDDEEKDAEEATEAKDKGEAADKPDSSEKTESSEKPDAKADAKPPESTTDRPQGRRGGDRGERRGNREGDSRRGGRRGGRFRDRLKEMDENGDGKIQKSEVPERMHRFFDRLDTNKDGVIDEDELKAPPSRRGDRPGRSRGGESGEPPVANAVGDHADGGHSEPNGARDDRNGGNAADRAAKNVTEILRDSVRRVVLASARLFEVVRDKKAATADEKSPRAPVNEETASTIAAMAKTMVDPKTAAAAAEAQAKAEPESEPQAVGQEPAAIEAKPEADAKPVAAKKKPVAPEEAGAMDVAPSPAEAAAPTEDDPISGEWTAQRLTQEGPGGGEFFMTLTLAADGSVSGTYSSQFSDGETTSGRFDRETSRLSVVFDTGRFTVDFRAKVTESGMTGDADVGDGMFGFDFKATRTKAAASVGAAVVEGEAKEVEAKPLTELLPGPRWVSSIEASRFEAGRVYVTLDAHRSNDDEPYVFVSEDHGETWRSIRANLPTSAGTTRVIREDIENPDILYLGVEFGAWVSIDRAKSWSQFNGNFPTVAVHEFAIHPTAGEIVAATHGRSLWVLDVAPLRQMTKAVIENDVHLFKPSSAVYWRSEPTRGGVGARRFVGENPTSGADIFYALDGAAAEVKIEITDLAGKTIREIEGKTEPGLHRVNWDLRRKAQPRRGGARRRGGGGGGRGGGGRGFRGNRGRLVPSGTYLVALHVDGESFTEQLIVETDPDHPDYKPWATEEADLAFELFMNGGKNRIPEPDEWGL